MLSVYFVMMACSSMYIPVPESVMMKTDTTTQLFAWVRHYFVSFVFPVSCGNFVKKKGTNLSFSFPFLSFLPLSSACYAGGNVEGHLQQISSTTNIDIEHYNIITLAHTSYIVHELNTTVAPNSTYFTVHANSQCSKLLYHG